MTPEENTEVEAKLQLVGQNHLDDPGSTLQSLTGYTTGPAKHIEVFDSYFDTPDHALLRHGYSVRIRDHATNGDQPVGRLVTLKTLSSNSDGSVHERGEWEASLTPKGKTPYKKAWPPVIRERVESITSGRMLYPLIRLRQQRTKHILRARDDKINSLLFELSLDRVSLYPPSPSDSQGSIAHFDELEIELQAGEKKGELYKIVRHLKQQLDLAPVSSSKFERALQALSATPAMAASGDSKSIGDLHVAEFCRLVCHMQFMTILLLEHRVRAHEGPECIHDMRVATRCIRVAFDLFSRYYVAKPMRKFTLAVRELARRLGRIRDIDVALENLARYQMAQPESSDSKATNDLARRWQHRRKRKYKKLLTYLDSPAYAKFVANFSNFCATTGLAVRIQHESAKIVMPTLTRHIMPNLIWQQFTQVRAYEPLLSSGRVVPYETLHSLRIACKYLRYILDFCEPMLNHKNKRYYKRLKALQAILGDLNDGATELAWLSRQAKQRPDLQVRIAFVEEQADLLRAQVRPALEQVTNDSARKNLGRLVAMP